MPGRICTSKHPGCGPHAVKDVCCVCSVWPVSGEGVCRWEGGHVVWLMFEVWRVILLFFLFLVVW
jgi:hypothetical protein